MKNIWIIPVLFVVVVITWLVVYAMSGVANERLVEEFNLKVLRREWQLDGSPKNPRIETYTYNPSNGISTYFVYTNNLTVRGKSVVPLFAANSIRFDNEGILVIATNGAFIWINAKGQPRIIEEGWPTTSEIIGTIIVCVCLAGVFLAFPQRIAVVAQGLNIRVFGLQIDLRAYRIGLWVAAISLVLYSLKLGGGLLFNWLARRGGGPL